MVENILSGLGQFQVQEREKESSYISLILLLDYFHKVSNDAHIQKMLILGYFALH